MKLSARRLLTLAAIAATASAPFIGVTSSSAQADELPVKDGWVWRLPDGTVQGSCKSGYRPVWSQVPDYNGKAMYWASSSHVPAGAPTYVNWDQLQKYNINSPMAWGYAFNLGAESVTDNPVNGALYEGDCVLDTHYIPGGQNNGKDDVIVKFQPYTDLLIFEMPNDAGHRYDSWFDQHLKNSVKNVNWDTVNPADYRIADLCKSQWDKIKYLKPDAVNLVKGILSDGVLTRDEDRAMQKMAADGLIVTKGGQWINECKPVDPTPPVNPEPPVVTPPVNPEPETPVTPVPPVTDPEPETPAPPVPPAPPVNPNPEPRPTPKPVVKYVTRTFQVDRYSPKTQILANRVAALDDDGVLKRGEDWMGVMRPMLQQSKWQIITVKVPANATKAQLIKAINAKTSKAIGDVSTTSRLSKLKAGQSVTMAWEAMPKSWLIGRNVANNKAPQVFFARS